jgi:hypothetical protein
MSEACQVTTTPVEGLVPVHVLYFSRLEWHSGEKIGQGFCEQTRFAYVLLLPATLETIYSHTVLTYNDEDMQMQDGKLHRLIPISHILRPLIVDKSMGGVVTLVPFQGKGLVDIPHSEPTCEDELDEINWEDVIDIVEQCFSSGGKTSASYVNPCLKGSISMQYTGCSAFSYVLVCTSC